MSDKLVQLTINAPSIESAIEIAKEEEGDSLVEILTVKEIARCYEVVVIVNEKLGKETKNNDNEVVNP